MPRQPASPSASTPATALLARMGEAFTAHSYDANPGAVSYGAEAAAQLAPALGVEPRQVFKTLVVQVDDALVVAVLPVTSSLSLKALASAAGGKRARLAAVGDAERATGYVVGGISPLGQRRRLPTYLDSSALEHSAVLVSGGRRGLDLQLPPDTLIRLTGAVCVPIAQP
jgi:Cys-tRNA(Pro)/Cys-tRNA(Cys) deacylase